MIFLEIITFSFQGFLLQLSSNLDKQSWTQVPHQVNPNENITMKLQCMDKTVGATNSTVPVHSQYTTHPHPPPLQEKVKWVSACTRLIALFTWSDVGFGDLQTENRLGLNMTPNIFRSTQTANSRWLIHLKQAYLMTRVILFMNLKQETRRLQLQATVKRSRFDLDLDLESQYTLISLWFQTQVSLNIKGQLGCTYRVHIARLNHQIFMVFCHNVLINCSELLSVEWKGRFQWVLSIEVLHLTLCEEMAQLQGKICIFFSLGVITSP